MSVPHGVVWHSVPAGASSPSCEASVPVHATVNGEGKTNWKGSCAFSQAGTYVFYCSVHGSEMTGSITVNANGTTTTTTSGTTTTTSTAPPSTTTTTNAAPPPSSESPLAGVSARALKLSRRQRGGTVRGSIAISQAGAGGRLQIDLLAARASLAKARHARHASPVRVGRLVLRPLRAGMNAFAVRLNARARKALRRHRRLALIVRVIVTPAHGKAVTLTRSIVAHA